MRVVVDKLTQPAGVAFKDGALYVFAIDKVLKYDGIASNPNVQPQDLTAKFDLPPEQHHNWKYVAFGPDGKLYVPFGSPCNICESPKEYAQIRRYNADGSGKEVIATGVRNSVGFDWHPKTKELWFTDHGRDWAGDKGFEDELNKMSKPARTSASRIATPTANLIPTSRRRTPAKALPGRSRCSGRTPRAWASSSIPARCSRPSTRTPPSSRARARGTARSLRLRRRERARRRGRQSEHPAVHDRLPGRHRGLQVLGPPGVHRADARRGAARVRRAGRRDLPRELPEAESAAKKQ